MRAITWIKEHGAEFTEVSLGATYLRAAGVAVGAVPLAYWLEYELDCAEGFVTRGLVVHTHGAGWSRRIELSRDPQGVWGIEAGAEGDADLPAPGGDPAVFVNALDCDLGECPVTNTMPVLRHGLLHGPVGGGKPRNFLMARVSVPDLSVRPSAQAYAFVGRPAAAQVAGAAAVVRFEGENSSSNVVFDTDGLVLDYPGLCRRA